MIIIDIIAICILIGLFVVYTGFLLGFSLRIMENAWRALIWLVVLGTFALGALCWAHFSLDELIENPIYLLILYVAAVGYFTILLLPSVIYMSWRGRLVLGVKLGVVASICTALLYSWGQYILQFILRFGDNLLQFLFFPYVYIGHTKEGIEDILLILWVIFLLAIIKYLIARIDNALGWRYLDNQYEVLSSSTLMALGIWYTMWFFGNVSHDILHPQRFHELSIYDAPWLLPVLIAGGILFLLAAPFGLAGRR